MNRNERKANLVQQYYFTCQCTACVSDDQLFKEKCAEVSFHLYLCNFVKKHDFIFRIIFILFIKGFLLPKMLWSLFESKIECGKLYMLWLWIFTRFQSRYLIFFQFYELSPKFRHFCRNHVKNWRIKFSYQSIKKISHIY